jgi:uncharacterized protein (TIGR03084 family)
MCHSPGMTIFDDLQAEQDRLEQILLGLDEGQWASPSGAQGWSVADVVLHLAQSEETVEASATRSSVAVGLGAAPGGTVEDRAESAVRAERDMPAAEVFGRWQRARRDAMAALRAADATDPDEPVPWVAGPLKPATLATTRLTEHWAHGLDITGPLGIALPDTARLRHVAWLAHRTLPYAMQLDGETPAPVRCELTPPGDSGPDNFGPDGSGVWRFGPAEAESVITGPARDFCRVAVRRLDPGQTALRAQGPAGATALRLLRTFA